MNRRYLLFLCLYFLSSSLMSKEALGVASDLDLFSNENIEFFSQIDLESSEKELLIPIRNQHLFVESASFDYKLSRNSKITKSDVFDVDHQIHKEYLMRLGLSSFEILIRNREDLVFSNLRLKSFHDRLIRNYLNEELLGKQWFDKKSKSNSDSANKRTGRPSHMPIDLAFFRLKQQVKVKTTDKFVKSSFVSSVLLIQNAIGIRMEEIKCLKSKFSSHEYSGLSPPEMGQEQKVRC